MKEIKVACQGADLVEIDHMKELQGELKSLTSERYQMLKKEILDTGFAFPIHIWKDEHGTRWIVGGHQRKRTLEAMRNEGYAVPPIPVSYIDAATIKDARRRVLQDVAQYGDVEKQGLYEFVTVAEIAPADLAGSFKLPDFDLPLFNAEFFFDDRESSPPPGVPQDSGHQQDPLSEPDPLASEEKKPRDKSCPSCGYDLRT